MEPVHLACEPWVEHLRRHLPVSELGQDPEGVHQVRVAAARLRVWLRLGGRRMLEDDLRWLRNGAGPVRDLDVLLMRGGPEAYERHLREEWIRAHASWVSTLRSHRAQGLMRALGLAREIDLEAAFARTRRWTKRARKIGDRLDWSSCSEAEMHAFRRRVRRLRYAREWIGRPHDGIKQLAERVGQLSDLFLLRERVESGQLPAEIAPPLEDVLARIVRKRARFAKAWEELSATVGESL